MIRLHLNSAEAALAGFADGAAPTRIAPGIDAVARMLGTAPDQLGRGIETAIQTIEDELARVPRHLHGGTVTSASRAVVDVALAAGLTDLSAQLHREAVEQAFGRLSLIAAGRSHASQGLPASLDFAAGLILVREFMHHLDIEAIALET